MPILLTAAIREQLLVNDRRRARGEEIDPPPVVKLFTPDGAGTWLLTELDPAEPTRAFARCDAGLDSPELGYVCLVELAALRGRFRLPVERDLHLRADRPLSAYAAAAHATGRIAV